MEARQQKAAENKTTRATKLIRLIFINFAFGISVRFPFLCINPPPFYTTNGTSSSLQPPSLFSIFPNPTFLHCLCKIRKTGKKYFCLLLCLRSLCFCCCAADVAVGAVYTIPQPKSSNNKNKRNNKKTAQNTSLHLCRQQPIHLKDTLKLTNKHFVIKSSKG